MEETHTNKVEEMELDIITQILRENDHNDIASEYEEIINRIDDFHTRERLNILVKHFFLWKLASLEERLAELREDRKLNRPNQKRVVVGLDDQTRQIFLMQCEIEKLQRINEDLLLTKQKLIKEIGLLREETMNRENRKITRLKELFKDEEKSIM